MQRLQVANNGGCPLYSLAWCEGRGGMLGAAGVEKTVNLIDLRKYVRTHTHTHARVTCCAHVARTHWLSVLAYPGPVPAQSGRRGVWRL